MVGVFRRDPSLYWVMHATVICKLLAKSTTGRRALFFRNYPPEIFSHLFGFRLNAECLGRRRNRSVPFAQFGIA